MLTPKLELLSMTIEFPLAVWKQDVSMHAYCPVISFFEILAVWRQTSTSSFRKSADMVKAISLLVYSIIIMS